MATFFASGMKFVMVRRVYNDLPGLFSCVYLYFFGGIGFSYIRRGWLLSVRFLMFWYLLFFFYFASAVVLLFGSVAIPVAWLFLFCASFLCHGVENLLLMMIAIKLKHVAF